MAVYLTKAQYNALASIIENGWGDGDYRGYGGEKPSVQEDAMKAFQKAKFVTIKKEARND